MSAAAQLMASTRAVLALRAAGVDVTPRFCQYEEHGGTAVSVRELGRLEHEVVNTVVMADELPVTVEVAISQ